MKTKISKKFRLTFTVLSFFSCAVIAQKNNPSLIDKPIAGMVSLESKGVSLDAEQLGSLARIELEKTDKFRVVDKYDTKEAVEKNGVRLHSCFGKNCLVAAGKVLQAEKMFSGSVELYGEKLIVTLRMIDVTLESIEKNQVNEFMNIQGELQSMLRITLNNLLQIPNDTLLVHRLTRSSAYESSTLNPGQRKVNLSGPRMGAALLMDDAQKVMTAAKKDGGFDGFPLMSQFGNQFETQYLNEGNFQALVEFIPLISGIDQGRFIPSLTLLNGFRNNMNGWEIAFGPTITTIQVAKGFYDKDGQWHLASDWNDSTVKPDLVERMDSRGYVKITSGWVFAVGKTFRSGKLNIPVNAFIVPSKNTTRIGVSFGFNNKK